MLRSLTDVCQGSELKMRSGASLYRLCLAVVLGLASSAQAATYNVTLMEGPDQPGTGDYTLAGAIAAANLDAEPAEVLIHLPYVWLDAPLILENTVTISPAEPDGRADIYPRDGVLTALEVGAQGSGSRLVNVTLVYDGPTIEGTTGIALCDTNFAVDGGTIGKFGKALDLQCGTVDLTVEGVVLGSNDFALTGALTSGSILNLADIEVLGNGALMDIQASECGGQLVVDRVRAAGLPSGIPANSKIALAGCVDLTIHNGQFRFGSVFMQADTLPSADDSLVSTVLLDQVMVHDYATGNQPLIQFNGDLLTLRHSTVARNQSNADNCVAIAGGDIHLYHSVIADNPCHSVALTGMADLQYSLVDIEWLGGSVSRDATSLALLGQAASFEGLLPTPAPDSPLLDAGDPTLEPGLGETPLTDIRGSVRLTGAVLDIGAAEFNRLPEFDRQEFIARLHEGRKSWHQMGLGPDDIMGFHLPEFISDPDGDDYVIHGAVAVVNGERTNIWNPNPLSPWQLMSGPIRIFLNGMTLEVEVEDEKGLRGLIVVEIPPVRADSGGAFWMLPLVLLLGRRRRAL